MRALIALIMLATVFPDIRSALAVVRQGRDASDLVSNAFAQFVANHLDSAETLIGPILSGRVKATRERRATALVLHGAGRFFHGQDSTARASFTAALALKPDFHGDWLFDIDSTLGHVWQQEQNRTLCGDPDAVTLDSTKRETTRPAVLTAKPRITLIPEVMPPFGTQGGMHGRVLLSAVINPAGKVTHESIHILRREIAGMGQEAAWALEHAAFLPGRIGDRAVSVCALLPFDFDIKP
jgi:hypothetical protein